MQVPFGLAYIQPETGKAAARGSFSIIVNSVRAYRMANPALVQKHGWATDIPTIENEVEQYNVRVCQAQGWTQYLDSEAGEPPPPKSRPPSQLEQSQVAAAGVKAAKIWSGVKTINEWYDSQEPAVPAELSEARAKACSECPFNEPGDYTKWFTMPAAEAVRRQVEKFSHRKLSTPYDDKLHTCRACLCVNKLAVHAPLRLKLAHMRPDVYAELQTAPACWVVKEKEAGGGS